MTNTKSKIFFTSVIVSLIFAWFFILPVLQAIDSAKKAIELENEDIRLLEEVQEQVQEAVSFFFSVSAEEKELIELAVPSYPDKVNAIILFDKLARENGLKVNEIGIAGVAINASAKNEQVFSGKSVSFILEGSYPSIKQFIVRAEKSLRIFDVQNINIKIGDIENQNPNILSAEITGNVYFTDTANNK